MKSYSICSIIAKNYVSLARTLCHSFLNHHPDGTCYVIIIDDIDGYIDPIRENFTAIRLTELAIPNLKEFCFKYSVTEAATAIKPYLLEYLFNKFDMDKLLYFDPDMLILNKIDEIYEELNDCDYIITPHIDVDYPEDGMQPNDSTILTHGIFNLGFIGVRNSELSLEFLRWWQNKLYDKCLIDYSKGFFVDQKFMDLAIVLFKNYAILSRPGCNAAYWNLHSRKISIQNNIWQCNGDKLFFYHFSSYRIQEPLVISRYQNRFSFKEANELEKLFSFFRMQVEKNGYHETIKWPYTYNYFYSGRQIIPLHRRIYRRNRDKIMCADPFEITLYPLAYRVFYGVLDAIRFVKKVYRQLRRYVSGRAI